MSLRCTHLRSCTPHPAPGNPSTESPVAPPSQPSPAPPAHTPWLVWSGKVLAIPPTVVLQTGKMAAGVPSEPRSSPYLRVDTARKRTDGQQQREALRLNRSHYGWTGVTTVEPESLPFSSESLLFETGIVRFFSHMIPRSKSNRDTPFIPDPEGSP